MHFLSITVERASAASGTLTVPSIAYPTLLDAINDINATGSTGAGVTINVGGLQTAPAGGYVIGGGASLLLLPGTNSPVTINGVAGNSISAGVQVAGSLNDAIIKIVGADQITIQNCTLVENPAASVTLAASNGFTEW